MNNIKVSIIIPAYNVEPYIKDCLDSIFQQTLKEIEIICIDDCSPDNSEEIIKSYAEKDSRIKYFKMPVNSGSGLSRNLGLENAKGEFISFMDPDDLYHNNNTLETLYNKAIENNVDACGGNISFFSENDNKISNPWSEIDFIKEGFMEYTDYHFPAGYWRFIYKNEVIQNNNIKFPNYPRRQDPVFFVKVMSIIKSFYVITEYSYSYRLEHKKMKWDKTKLSGVLNSFSDNFKIYEENKLWHHYARDLMDMQNYLSIIYNIDNNDELIEQAKAIIDNIPYKMLYSIESNYTITNKEDSIKRMLTNKRSKKSKLIKIICLFIPVKSWRNKLRGKK